MNYDFVCSHGHLKQSPGGRRQVIMAGQSIYSLQADLCRAMGNPVRIEIVHLLRIGLKRVGDIAATINCAQPAVSRHLAALRNAGVVVAHREGNSIVHGIANPKITEVCDLMREALSEQFGRLSKIMEG
jgi:DNA-binding transcriptional ArsR family regulator